MGKAHLLATIVKNKIKDKVKDKVEEKKIKYGYHQHPIQTTINASLPTLFFSNNHLALKQSTPEGQQIIRHLERLHEQLTREPTLEEIPIYSAALDEETENSIHSAALDEFFDWVDKLSLPMQRRICQLAPKLGEQIKYITVPDYWSIDLPSKLYLIRGLEEALHNNYIREQLSQLSEAEVRSYYGLGR